MADLRTPLSSEPPPVIDTLISFPAPHVLLATLNRPAHLNSIPRVQSFALGKLWQWFDNEPSLRVAVLTGSGRAFCAGADLKTFDNTLSADDPAANEGALASRFPTSGFGGISNRAGSKPIIAAVNGFCFGGGMEIATNCDLVIASDDALFSLPEVKVGLIALAGALPRLIKTVGRQRASEMALGGGRYDAATMKSWGVVNEVVPDGSKNGGKIVLEKALEWAARIVANSPDAVIASREGLKLGWEAIGPEAGTDVVCHDWFARLEKGENKKEGIASFVERRKPVWRNSRL